MSVCVACVYCVFVCTCMYVCLFVRLFVYECYVCMILVVSALCRCGWSVEE